MRWIVIFHFENGHDICTAILWNYTEKLEISLLTSVYWLAFGEGACPVSSFQASYQIIASAHPVWNDFSNNEIMISFYIWDIKVKQYQIFENFIRVKSFLDYSGAAGIYIAGPHRQKAVTSPPAGVRGGSPPEWWRSFKFQKWANH